MNNQQNSSNNIGSGMVGNNFNEQIEDSSSRFQVLQKTNVEDEIKNIKKKISELQKIKYCKSIYSNLVLWTIILFFILGVIMFLTFLPITEDKQVSIILTFVGIAATFVVVSNYAQVKDIESKFESKIKEVDSKFESKIKEVDNNFESKIKEVDSKALNQYAESYFLMAQLCITLDDNKEQSNNNYYLDYAFRYYAECIYYSSLTFIDDKKIDNYLGFAEIFVSDLEEQRKYGSYKKVFVEKFEKGLDKLVSRGRCLEKIDKIKSYLSNLKNWN